MPRRLTEFLAGLPQVVAQFLKRGSFDANDDRSSRGNWLGLVLSRKAAGTGQPPARKGAADVSWR